MAALALPIARLGERPTLIAIFLAVPLAAWYSLSTLANVAFSDTPLAFVVLVPVLAAYLLVHYGRLPAADRAASDSFFDVLVFVVLFLASGYLLLVLPIQLSWYYWFARLDLLIVPLVALAAVVMLWGFGGAVKVWPALLYLTLVWTYPLILAQQVLGPILTTLSAAFGALAVEMLALPLRVSPNDPTYFISTGPEKFTIIISSVCSGQDALLGFLLVATPLLLTWSGSTQAKLGWLFTGAAVAWLSNAVRITVLFILSSYAGVDFALGTVHPALGTVLFVGVFATMLWLTPSFGIAVRRSSARAAPALPQSGVRPAPKTYLLVFGLSLILAAGQPSLRQFSPPNTGSLPALAVSDALAVIPNVPGWERTYVSQVNWQNLFGRDSQSHLLAYDAAPASVIVQYVATPNKNLLDAYTLVDCDLFHGEQIVGVSPVDLGYGVRAQLVGSRKGELNNNTLYWFLPVLIDDRIQHTRIALMADQQMLPPDRSYLQEYERDGQRDWRGQLATFLSAQPSIPPPSDFAELDAYIVTFGRQMVQAIMSQAQSSR